MVELKKILFIAIAVALAAIVLAAYFIFTSGNSLNAQLASTYPALNNYSYSPPSHFPSVHAKEASPDTVYTITKDGKSLYLSLKDGSLSCEGKVGTKLLYEHQGPSAMECLLSGGCMGGWSYVYVIDCGAYYWIHAFGDSEQIHGDYFYGPFNK